MKCECCGHEVKPKTALPYPGRPIYGDAEGVLVTDCSSCNFFIYRLDEDADWLHLRTDARSCDAE